MAATGKTFVCGHDCTLPVDRSWTPLHDEAVMRHFIRHGGPRITRSQFELRTLATICTLLHNDFPTACFSKQFVLKRFSALVMRYNAWTYLTRLPGVDVIEFMSLLHVPTVLRLGIQQVSMNLCYLRIIYFPKHKYNKLSVIRTDVPFCYTIFQWGRIRKS